MSEITERISSVTYCRAALKEIAKGRGRFSTDHHQHATNTIEDMIQVAQDALAGTWEPDDE